jgi:hypothetical protein
VNKKSSTLCSIRSSAYLNGEYAMPLNSQQQNIIDDIARKAEIVLDEYLTARMQYTFLCRTIDDQNVTGRFDNSRAAHIFNLLLSTILKDIIKSLYNLVFDKDSRSASINNLLEKLKEHKLLFESDKMTCRPVHLLNEKDLPIPLANEFKKNISEKQAAEMHRKFLTLCENFNGEYKQIMNHSSLLTVKKIRDKVVSHPDVRRVSNTIERTSIAHFDFQWEQLDTFIDDVEKLVGLSLACCASTSHFFQHSKDQYLNISKEFWDISRSKGWLWRGGVHITDKKRRKIRHHLRSRIGN